MKRLTGHLDARCVLAKSFQTGFLTQKSNFTLVTVTRLCENFTRLSLFMPALNNDN